jgi:hypothetical protein
VLKLLKLVVSIEEKREIKKENIFLSAFVINIIDQDMAARHRARFRSVQIIRVAEVKDADIRRQYIKQLLTPKLAFPLPHRLANVDKKHRALFVAKRPTTFY